MFGMGFVCCLWELCWALGLSVISGNYVGHLVCLFVCCLVDLCLALRLYVIFWELCFALGLSVCWLDELCLVMIGLFGTKSKLGFYIPFNSQGHIGTGPQNCHLWDSNPQR